MATASMYMTSLIGEVHRKFKLNQVKLHGYKPDPKKSRNPRQCWVTAGSGAKVRLRAKKLAAAASAAFELRDAVSRLPNPTAITGAGSAVAWSDVLLEVDALHERLESMAVINRWAVEERETLIHRTARLHTKLAAGAVHLATIGR